MQAFSERQIYSLPEAEIISSFPLLCTFALEEFRENGFRISDRWWAQVRDETERTKQRWIRDHKKQEFSFKAALGRAKAVADDTFLFPRNIRTDQHYLIEIMLLVGYDIGKEEKLTAASKLIFDRLVNLHILPEEEDGERISKRRNAILAILIIGSGYNPISRKSDDLDIFKSFMGSDEFGHTRERSPDQAAF